MHGVDIVTQALAPVLAQKSPAVEAPWEQDAAPEPIISTPFPIKLYLINAAVLLPASSKWGTISISHLLKPPVCLRVCCLCVAIRSDLTSALVVLPASSSWDGAGRYHLVSCTLLALQMLACSSSGRLLVGFTVSLTKSTDTSQMGLMVFLSLAMTASGMSAAAGQVCPHSALALLPSTKPQHRQKPGQKLPAPLPNISSTALLLPCRSRQVLVAEVRYLVRGLP